MASQGGRMPVGIEDEVEVELMTQDPQEELVDEGRIYEGAVADEENGGASHVAAEAEPAMLGYMQLLMTRFMAEMREMSDKSTRERKELGDKSTKEMKEMKSELKETLDAQKNDINKINGKMDIQRDGARSNMEKLESKMGGQLKEMGDKSTRELEKFRVASKKDMKKAGEDIRRRLSEEVAMGHDVVTRCEERVESEVGHSAAMLTGAIEIATQGVEEPTIGELEKKIAGAPAIEVEKATIGAEETAESESESREKVMGCAQSLHSHRDAVLANEIKSLQVLAEKEVPK
uniref:apolipoprotein E-like n=1 Tax=Myxine glutinosa TaxID=7769 RepID=UPI00359003FA